MSHWKKSPWLLAGPLFLLFGLKFSCPNIEKIHKIIPQIAAKPPNNFKTFGLGAKLEGLSGDSSWSTQCNTMQYCWLLCEIKMENV